MFQKRIFCQLDFAFAYLDDIVIASSSNDEHFGHLRQVFDVLSTNSLVISKSKCVFGVTELDYLGDKVTIKGIQPIPDSMWSIKIFQFLKADLLSNASWDWSTTPLYSSMFSPSQIFS